MKNFVIGVGSQFNGGKDVLCNYLCEYLNRITDVQWKRAAFASNVKKIFMSAFNVDFDFIEKWKREDTPPEGFSKPIREALTFIGDGFRDIVPTIWIDSLLKNNDSNLIISDIRYINEAIHIRKNNGIAILLWRPNYENDFPNRSEQELMPYVNKLKGCPDGEIINPEIPFDLWIKNDGGLDRLYNKIEEIVIPCVIKRMKTTSLVS